MSSRTFMAAGVVLALVLVSLGLVVRTLRHGLSTRDAPTAMERTVARTMRHWATPSDLRGRRNAIKATPEVLAEARAHFADHCASCHGNDGKGQSGLGRQMYPRTPDMTLASTQQLSDGELFAIIENGVRLTGMPAFGDGTAGSAEGSWKLVHLIRHLPEMSTEELAGMERLNPKSPEEWRQMQEETAFLEGGNASSPSGSKDHARQH